VEQHRVELVLLVVQGVDFADDLHHGLGGAVLGGFELATGAFELLPGLLLLREGLAEFLHALAGGGDLGAGLLDLVLDGEELALRLLDLFDGLLFLRDEILFALLVEAQGVVGGIVLLNFVQHEKQQKMPMLSQVFHQRILMLLRCMIAFLLRKF
jgi:hypothetical protein